MSMSLRDQLLQAGLVSKKQVQEVERQQQRSQGRPAKPRNGQSSHLAKAPTAAPASAVKPTSPVTPASNTARSSQADKAARDHALNRRNQEKAQRKAKAAEIRQLIEQHRLPPIASEDHYNFLDGSRIRKIPVDTATRAALVGGDLAIVRNGGRYDLVSPAVALRIRERDATAVMATVSAQNAAVEQAYLDFPIPDDLIW